VRRRAMWRLGVLAAALLVAGGLPWVTAGPLAARLIALPLLLAGVLVSVVAVRVRPVAPAPAPAAAPAPLVERRCDGCVCGVAGGCGVLSRNAPGQSAASNP
jgi:hypothetical protein